MDDRAKPKETKFLSSKKRKAEESESDDDTEDVTAASGETTVLLSSLDKTADSEIAFLYSPSGGIADAQRLIGKHIELRIPAKYLTVRNREVQRCQLWGTDIYTADSDAVAVLMHMGRVILRQSAPSGFMGVTAVFRVVPGSSFSYKSSTRGGIRSRAWPSQYDGASMQLVRVDKIEKGSMMTVKPKGEDSKMSDSKEIKLVRMTPSERAQSVKPKPKKKHLADVVFLSNAQNDICLKYSLDLMKDSGVDEQSWTSSRLKRECFYFETKTPAAQYELSKEKDKDTVGKFCQYRWSLVALPQSTYAPKLDVYEHTNQGPSKRRKVEDKSFKPPSVPLEPAYARPLEKNLDWEEIEWGPQSVIIRGKEYQLQSVNFKPLTGQ